MSIQQLKSETLGEFKAQLTQVHRIGIDTEFHAERRFTPQLLLIQVYVPNGDTWIIDPTRPSSSPEVATLITAKEWILHGGRFDLLLLKSFLGSLPNTVWDTQIGAGLLELKYPASYGHLVKKHLGIELPKHATLSNWARRPLNKMQLQYAADDVVHLLSLWDRISEQLKEKGRFVHAAHYCAKQLEDAGIRPDPSELLRRHPVLPHLQPQQASVLKELLVWRFDIAVDNNQPVRSVLSDGHLVELAKRQPSTVDELREDRRMPKRVINNYGADLVERIQRSGNRPEWAWPTFIRKDTQEWVQLQILMSFVLKDGFSESYGQRLVLPMDTLESIVLTNPTSLSALNELIGDPAADIVGPRLWAFLSGVQSLSF